MKITPLVILCAAIAISLVTPEARATHQVVNGGFETSTTTSAPPWTYTDSSNFTGFGMDSAFAHSGSRYAYLCATGTIGSISQMITPAAGQLYSVSFWLANDGGLPPNSFQALINGVSMFSLVNAPGFGYTLFSFNFVGTGLLTNLEFRYRNDSDFWRLDDVSVNVPETGATAWLALPAIAGLFVLRSRLRRA